MRINEFVSQKQLDEIAPVVGLALRALGGIGARALGGTAAKTAARGIGSTAARTGATVAPMATRTGTTAARTSTANKSMNNLKALGKKKVKNYIKNKLSLGGDGNDSQNAADAQKVEKDLDNISKELKATGETNATLEKRVKDLENEIVRIGQQDPVAALVQRLGGGR